MSERVSEAKIRKSVSSYLALPEQDVPVAHCVQEVIWLCAPHAGDEHDMLDAEVLGRVDLVLLTHPVDLLGLLALLVVEARFDTSLLHHVSATRGGRMKSEREREREWKEHIEWEALVSHHARFAKMGIELNSLSFAPFFGQSSGLVTS